MMITGDFNLINVYISFGFKRFSEGRLNREFGVGGCLVLRMLVLHGCMGIIKQMLVAMDYVN